MKLSYQDPGIVNPTQNTVMALGTKSSLTTLRKDEYTVQSTDFPVDGYSIEMYFTSKDSVIMGAWLSIIRTFFVCIVLALSILKLSRDTEILVLEPLEAVIKKVDRISKNPLEAAAIEEKESQEMEEIKHKNIKEYEALKERSSYEPAILEKTVIKIGSLLAIGFGEAGSAIIAQNMAQGSGSVNPMLEGKKIIAIFGFCDIRSFSEITDVLKTDILPFVNKIADIIHSIVNLHQGAPNKNIGEAFLLVWKIPESETMRGEFNQIIPKPPVESFQIRTLADLAVISFIKVIAATNKSQKLYEMCNVEGLLHHFNVSTYRVSMGFGLHIGWGIEGAIGSKFKIDASYLSPNVNMSARLEAASRQFGVNLLVSGVLEQYLTPNVKRKLRQIDRVTVKGSIQPMGKNN